MGDVTLKDLAEALEISVATVSKALKNYSDVSPSTKKRVKELAETLNYTPNSLAVNFRTKESKTIGLIIPEVVHHFFSNIIKGIIAQAEKKGYLVIILQSNESYKLEKKQLDLLVSKRVDGVLMTLSNGTANYKHINAVLDRDIPLILFDKTAKLVNCSKVIINDRKAAFIAVEHLIKSGCKRIAHFRGPLLPLNSIDRFLGYKKALETYNIQYDPSLVYTCKDVSFEEGSDFTQDLINKKSNVDGIFTVSDLVAIGAIAKLNELKIKIPEQISVIGFSNWFMSSAITPSLTTIDQPGYLMGKKAFKRLFKEMTKVKNKEPYKYKTIEVPTSLVVRNSTKKF